MARLARRVRPVPPGVYRHFEGKDEVLDAVLEMIRERLNANVVRHPKTQRTHSRFCDAW